MRGPLACLMALVVSVATLFTTTAIASAAPALPEPPWGLSSSVGVDGVMLNWYRGSTQTGGVPTTYVVHRRGPGYDADWVVPTATTSTMWSYADRSAPVDVEVTYMVTARNSAGDSAESAPVTARVPVWAGPYDPNRVSLTLVWDEAAGGDDTQRSTVVATASSTPALTQGWDNGISFSAGSWRQALVLPADVADGTYTVGDAEGMLKMRAMSGDFCGSGAGGAAPGGTATVSRAARSVDGLYASISVDASLDCGNGHRLRAELRWHTPEATHALATSALTVVTAAPGDSTTTPVTVTNTGTEPLSLGAARIVDSAMSTSAPLTVSGSTCEGLTLSSESECTVTVSYAAGPAASVEGNGVLVMSSDVGEWELGTVVGQQPSTYSGPQAVAGSASPGRLDLSWTAPTTLSQSLIRGWRIEDLGSGTPLALQTVPGGTTGRTTISSLVTGAHALRVVLLTTDGRQVASEPVPLTVASRWLLVTTANGIRAYDADGGVTNGGMLGSGRSSTDGVAVSPTRDRIVVSEGPYAGSVRVLGSSGDGVRILTSDSLVADRDPDVSPDGSTVVLLRPGYSGSQNRAASLVTVPVTGGPATVVPASAGLSRPAWTPDGAALVATTDSEAGLVRVNPVSGSRTPIPGTAGAAALAVSRSGRVAYALTGWGGSGEIRVTTLSGGASTLVGTHAGATDLSWDPTGQFLAVTGAPYGDPPTTRLFDLRSATPKLARQLPGGSSVSWLVPTSAAPSASLAAPAWTTSTANLTVGATDPDDAPGGLRRECQLDGAAWAPCSPVWSLAALRTGQHSSAVRVTDPSGQQSAIARTTWSVDVTVPTVALGALPSVLTTTALKLAWTASDSGGSGLGSVEIRYRAAPWNAGFAALTYPTAWRALHGTNVSTTLTAGKQYCFSARARDSAGNLSAWSGERCTSVVLDDRALAASAGWTRGAGSAYAFGTVSRATSTGVSLTRTSVQARRVAIVVTTCPTCGAVDVYHAGVRLGRVSLYSATTVYRQIRWLPLQTVTRTGSVVIRTTSTKASGVDGLAVMH